MFSLFHLVEGIGTRIRKRLSQKHLPTYLILLAFLLPMGCSESPKPPVPAGTQTGAIQGVKESVKKCDFQLRQEGSNGEVVVGPGQKLFKVNNKSVGGPLDGFTIKGDNILFSGWGYDRERNKPPSGFVIFMGAECIAFGKPTPRPDVAEAFKNPLMKETGFHFMLPLAALKNKPFKDFRILILTEDGFAGDMPTQKANEGENRQLWNQSGPR